MKAITEVEDLFWDYTMALLGLDQKDQTEARKVRFAYQTDGAPFQNAKEDVCYIFVTFGEDSINRQVESSYNGEEMTLKGTQVLQVSWTFYGPNANDMATAFRMSLFDSVKSEMLDLEGIKLVVDVPEVSKAPEFFQGQWWDRSDITARFNRMVDSNFRVDPIEHVGVTVNVDGNQIIVTT